MTRKYDIEYPRVATVYNLLFINVPYAIVHPIPYVG